MAKKKLKYYIQKLLGHWLDSPGIPAGRTTVFSVVRSELSHCRLGAHCRLVAPYVLHDVEMGDYSYVSRGALVANTTIGRFCSVGPHLCCGQGLHPTAGVSTHPMFYSTAKQNGVSLTDRPLFEESKHTTIGNDVFIGANVTIIDGVTIGDGAVVGAGAVVTRDVPPYAVAVGVPARVVKYRFDAETVQALLQRRWWDDPADHLHEVTEHFWDVKGFLTDKTQRS